MRETTSVVLITGFLGSGKTTFLNRIINNFPQDRKLTVLMNEFGEIGIDGMLLEGEDLDIMEISRGSIFCVCVKTDFIKGLYELNTRIRPDLLVIESTGVADPSDLKRDLLLPVFNNRFKLEEQFCIIDAPHFLEAFEVFAAVEKQLSTSTVFIINKVDTVSRESIEKIKTLIREYHPDPRFYETNHADVPLSSFPCLMRRNMQAGDNGVADEPLLTGVELDNYIKSVLENPESAAIPPDQLASVTYTWSGDSLDGIRQMADKLQPEVVRAKGVVRDKGVDYLFSYVMGDWTLGQCSTKEVRHPNTIVFIGSHSGIDSLAEIIRAPQWSQGKVLQPFAQIARL